MWLMAKGRLVSFFTSSMSRLMAAVVRNSVPMPPSPPALDTAAASSADVQVPIGARMTGTSIPNKSQRDVLSIVLSPELQAKFRRPLPVFRLLADKLDDAGEIETAVSVLGELVVNLGRMRADRGFDLHRFGSRPGKLEILEHQGGGKARLVAVIRRRRWHRPGHRTIAGQRPALAGRRRGDVEQRLMRQPEFFAEPEGFADRDHRRAEDHIVANLRGLAVAGLAAMHDALAHALEHRLAAREGVVGTADHEGERCRLGADDAARDRRIERGDAVGGCELMRLARALDVDGRAIDEQRVLPRLWRDVVPYRQHVLAGRQHGDDDIGILKRRLGAACDLHAVLGRGIAQRRYEIESKDVAAGLDEIGGHRPAHVAETDESNSRHVRSLLIAEL